MNQEITAAIRHEIQPLLDKIAAQQAEIDLLIEDTNVMKLIQAQLLTLVPAVSLKMFAGTLRKQLGDLPGEQASGEMAQIALETCDGFDAMYRKCYEDK